MPNPFTPEQIEQILEEFFKVVGTRQYIGARYVPLFGRKNETSIEWDNSAPYEPLTVVLYQGNSYTSRQYVPVGVEITNQEFWALSGNYNAQVEQYRRDTNSYREEVQTYVDRIDAYESLLPSADFSSTNTVKKYIDDNDATQDALLPASDFSSTNTVKKYIDDGNSAQDALLPASAFTSSNTVKDYIDDKYESAISAAGKKRVALYIGNSYTNGVGSTDDSTGLRALTEHFFDLSYRQTAGGAGFATYTDHTQTFYDLLQAAAASSAFDNNTITDVIFISAMGDTRALTEGKDAEVISNLQACSQYVLANFPNAQMHVAYAEMVYQRNTQSSYSNKYWLYQLRVHQIFAQQHELYNYNYLGWIGWNRNNTNGVNANDGYHPNDTGYRVLASAFANAWQGRSPYVRKTYSNNGINVFANDPLVGRIYLPSTLQAATFWPDGITSGTEYKMCDIVTDSAIAAVIPLQSVNSIFIPVLMGGTVHMASVYLKIDSTTGNAALYAVFRETIANPGNAYSGRQIWYSAQVTASPNLGVA